MTDSDSLRGDPNHDPTRRHHPELRELDTLRALLRPRMTEEGDPTPTDALRGMFIEIERLRATTSDDDRCRALESELASRSQAHEATRQTLQFLRGRLHEALSLSMDGASDKDIFERIEQLSTAQTTIRAHDLKHIESLGQRIRDLEGSLEHERKRSKLLAEEATAEQRLASAAATGHDHARGLLVAIAEVFGRVDDLDSLPAKVRELSDNCLHNCTKSERVQAHIEHAKSRVAEAEAALALLGWDRAQDMTTWARSSAQPVVAARWTKICEAFGFDPEQDPPVSIPAILAGNQWTNTRRMLADACAKLQAPSLEMVLGELIQALSKAHKAASDPHTTVLPASISELHESTCPELDEPCHVRIGKPRYMTSDSRLQVWVIEPVALPAYQISGRGASWQWNAELAGIKYAISGYETATDAIAGARAHNAASNP